MRSVRDQSSFGIDPRDFERRAPRGIAIILFVGLSLMLWAVGYGVVVSLAYLISP